MFEDREGTIPIYRTEAPKEPGQVVAMISPAIEQDAPPSITRARPFPAPARCHHHRFRLDEKWGEVFCGECGERVEAFAVLQRYAEWREDFDRRWDRAIAAEKRLYLEEARVLLKRVHITEEERAELTALIERAGYWTATIKEEGRVKEMGNIVYRIEAARKARSRESRPTRRRRRVGPVLSSEGE